MVFTVSPNLSLIFPPSKKKMRKAYKQTILRKEKQKDHKHVTASISQTVKVERLKEESFVFTPS